MPLTITSDTVLDEEFRATQTGTSDDNDVASSAFISAAVTDLGLTTVTGVTGFPQYAENTSFVSTSDPVTDWYLTLSSNGVGSDLYVGGNRVFLYATSDPDIIVGRLGTGTVANPGGAVALIVGVDDTSVSSPNLWTAQFAPFVDSGHNLVDSADELNLSGLVSLGATFTTTTIVPFENFDGLPSGNNLFNVIWPSDGSQAVELLVTGSKGGALSTVNVSTTGIGAGSQAIDVGATLRIDTVQGMDRTLVNEAKEVNDPTHIAYHDLLSDPDSDARVEITAADFEVTQLNPGTPSERVDIRVSAFNVAGADQGQTYLNNINANGTAVTIDSADIKVLDGAGHDITANLTITQDGDSVIIAGLDDGTSSSKTDGWQVFFSTDGVGFDRMLITNVDTGGTTLDVGNIHVTMTVGGTDSESTPIGANLIFQDDGPTIALASGATVPTITDHDSDFATNNSAGFAGVFGAPDYGADGAGSLSYVLGVKSAGVDSGLDDTLTGQNVVLTYDSATNTVYGKTQISGLEVFKITVDSTGNVTLDQSRAVVHTDTTSSSEISPSMAADLITLSATAVDSEVANHNDSATATANIGTAFIFQDDGPALTPQAAGSLTPNDLEVANGGSDSSSYGLLPGGDGQKSYTIVGPADSSGDFQWTYDNTTHTSITGTYKGTSLYTLTLNGANGTYVFNMLGALPGTTEGLSSTIIHAGGPTDTIDVLAKAPSTDFARIEADSTVGTGNVNASHGYVGVDNGNLDAGESLTFSLYQSDGTMIEFSSLTIGTKSAGTSHYNYILHMSDGSTSEIDNVEVLKGKAITVSDPNTTDHVLIDSVEVFKVDGNALKIGLGDIQFVLPPNDAQLGFSVQLTDGDNDTATRSFTVDIDGNGDGVYSATANSLSMINASASLQNTHPSPSGMMMHELPDYMLL